MFVRLTMTRRVPLVEQELLPFRSARVHPRFKGIIVA